MILFWIVYLLGVVATMVLIYNSLERGYKITVGDIVRALVLGVFSWPAFVIVLFICFGDYVVFTKK